MKRIKNFVSIIVFLLLMFFINEVLRYLLIDDSASLTRLMMHEFYTEEENIDILFLGSSHCYRSLNPQITDEIFQKNTFNAGSSLQGLDASYALLVEAGKENRLEEVYVEIFYGITKEVYSERNDLTATYLISDYMKHGLNRIALIMNAGPSCHFMNGFVLARRNADKILDMTWITDILSKKKKTKYRNYEYDFGYEGKGFVGSNIYMTQEELVLGERPEELTEEIISEDSRKYIEKIIRYCERNHIKLTFFSAPMHDFVVLSQDGYDVFTQQMRKLTDNTASGYLDFNLCEQRILDLQEEDFLDMHHLNSKGAEKFSRFFAEYFNNENQGVVIYDSRAQKFADMQAQAVGLIIEETGKGDSMLFYEITPVLSKSRAMEYQISVYPAEGDEKYLQEWSENTSFALPAGEHGVLIVEYRMAGADGEVRFIKKEY